MEPRPTPSQRSVQRRSPQADSGPAPNIPPARSFSPVQNGQNDPRNGPQSRGSISSARGAPDGRGSGSGTGGGGSRNMRQAGSTHSSTSGAPPLSQIEKSVTHLLVATKQLLETLTLWSRNEATDSQVSDVYVRLGYEFNIACRAFAAIHVDTSDLGNVPELLREILESTLSQEASQESLDKYLPKIRDIIIALLHGLKRKQQKLRQKQSRDLSSSHSGDKNDPTVPRNNSTSSIGSAGTGVTTLLNEGIDPNHMPPNYQIVDGKVVEKDGSHIPPRGSSMSIQTQRESAQQQGMPQRDISRGSLSSDQSTLSSTTMQNIPVLPPYPGDEATMPEPQVQQQAPKPAAELSEFPPPPPPPPKQNNALAALQNRGDLERRASRRFSTYQLTKHLGSQAPMPMPAFPQGQGRVPNRSRDLREGLNAVRGRQSAALHSATGSLSRVVTGDSPNRVPSRISERGEDGSGSSGQATGGENESPMVKTPEDKLRQIGDGFNDLKSPDATQPSATLNGPASDALPPFGLDDQQEQPKRKDLPPPDRAGAKSPTTYTPPAAARQFVPEESPQPGKELTLFLQYKTKIKKFVFQDGNDLSMARLQLAFIERFKWDTHNNGMELPEIYIQDPISGVRHELEDLSDIKDRSVLVLNVEALDEVKRHIDEGLGGLRKMVEDVKTSMEDQKVAMQRVAERQQDAVKEMNRLHTAPPSARTSFVPEKITPGRSTSTKNGKPMSSHTDVDELATLRRDLAVVRQTFASLQSNMDASMSSIKAKASSVKEASKKASIPEITGDSGRAYVSKGKAHLVAEADTIVSRVDDLQDIVEDLRKDVVLRGVRPLPRQLEDVARDLSAATRDLGKMQELLKRERPVWTRIWEKELEVVCEEREELTMQEDLVVDLWDDLEKCMGTFKLVEQATKEQMKEVGNGGQSGLIAGRRPLNHVGEIDPRTAKDGVLGEVRALQPNHESRLEAIERAEKARQKDLESRKGGEFQKELGNFVEEGRLKKSGGFEEVERVRRQRDEKVRREVWERQNGVTMADADLTPTQSENDGGQEGEEGQGEQDENSPPAQ